jgi:hypothetical protein
MDIISREEARAHGLKLFYTGKPCARGHDSERYVGEGKCVACHRENRQKYQERNRDAIKARRKEYRERNAERIKEQKRRDYEKHWNKRRAAHRAWYDANRDKALEYLRKWQAINADYFRQQKTAYYRARRAEDPQFAVLTRLRRRINHFVSSGNKSGKTAELIGCTYDAFMMHIEAQFTDGMSWGNRSEWHIDHIIPCAAFDLSDPEQQRQCFHYSNMRPLWAHENRRKGASMPEVA